MKQLATVKKLLPFLREDEANPSFYGWLNYTETSGSVLSADQTEIFYRTFVPKYDRAKARAAKNKRLMFIIHGWNEHSECYRHVASYFVEMGYKVVALDLRGHGRSQGARGHVDNWIFYVRDVQAVMGEVADQFRGHSIDILAHSMGGLVALRYLQTLRPGGIQSRLHRLVLSGPLLELAMPVTRLQRNFSRGASRITPRLSLVQKIDPALLTQDEYRLETFYNDDLRHNRITARWFTEMSDATAAALEDARFMTIPILVLHAESDRINAVEGSRKLIDTVRSENKELKTFPDMQHEILNEKNNRSVFEYIAAWLDR